MKIIGLYNFLKKARFAIMHYITERPACHRIAKARNRPSAISKSKCSSHICVMVILYRAQRQLLRAPSAADSACISNLPYETWHHWPINARNMASYINAKLQYAGMRRRKNKWRMWPYISRFCVAYRHISTRLIRRPSRWPTIAGQKVK